MIFLKKENQNIKKGETIEIKYIHIVSEKAPIKTKNIVGLCTRFKKNKTNPTITIKFVVLNEIISMTFCIKSPLILSIKKVKL